MNNPEPSAAQPPKTVYEDLARASWMAPLLAIVIHIGLLVFHLSPESKLRSVPTTVLLLGLLAGIIALIGAKKSNRQGIVSPALSGVVINALLMGTAIWASSRAQLGQSTQREPDPFLDYPGWWASARVSQAAISFASINDLSRASQEFNKLFATNVSFLSVAVDNVEGTNTINLDPSSIRLVFPDGATQPCIPTEQVCATAKTNQTELTARLSGMVTVPTGQKALDRSAFFPRGISYSNAVGMAVKINQKDYLIPGKYLTTQEKRKTGPAASAAHY